MNKLTGLELLNHHETMGGSSREKVLSAGYIKGKSNNPNFTLYYTELLAARRAEYARTLYLDKGGSKTIQNILKAAEERKNLRYRNDEVIVVNNNKVIIKYYETRLVTIDYDDDFLEIGILHNCEKTKSTKERLNRILMRFCGCQVYKKKGIWYIYDARKGEDLIFQSFKRIPLI